MLQKLQSFLRNDDPLTRIKWSLYGRVWRECGLPYWKLLAAGMICTIIAAGAEAYCITLVSKIADVLEAGIAKDGMAEDNLVELQMTALCIVGLQIVVAFTVKSAFGYAKTLAMSKAALLGVSSLRRRIYRHMLKQPISFFHDAQTGTIMNYFTGLAGAVLGLVMGSVIAIVQSTATLLFMFALMLWFAPQMTLLLLFLGPAVIGPLIYIIRKQRALVHKSIAIEGGALTHINQSILGVKTIQSFVMENKESENMDTIEDDRIKVSIGS